MENNNAATVEENNNVNGGLISKDTIDHVATWVGSTVSSAFFSSLERFSCVNVSTSDPDNDDDDDDGDYSITTSITPTATTTTTTTTSPPVVQVNGHNTSDVSNLSV
ncbi:hypothetical protein Lalb_Chr09g0332101 [Lupinus albus]|uniref:Uncharacterized protein n=1 Tax=Lupinus albus TaxID=3870 RepID=A0A6A4Q1U6_LUPAL|nr:hypothetical protein Lalb_Chr09g0332101 [Lupinus albus]